MIKNTLKSTDLQEKYKREKVSTKNLFIEYEATSEITDVDLQEFVYKFKLIFHKNPMIKMAVLKRKNDAKKLLFWGSFEKRVISVL